MPGLKAVLFDNDGTLADTHDLLLECFRFSTREVLGHALPDDALMEKVGQPLAVQVRDFSPDPAVQRRLREVYSEHNAKIHDEMIAGFPGMEDALSRLADAGLAMGVATSKMHAVAAHGLEVIGISGYFSCLVGADDCARHKPDPEPVLRGCELLGVEPAACAYVGDSPYDMQAGRAAGCVTAAVGWGMFSEGVLRAEGPTMFARTWAELADALVAAM